MLLDGGTAVGSVVAAVVSMEDDPVFDAGLWWYRATGAGFLPGPGSGSFIFGRGRGVATWVGFFLFLTDKSPITEKVLNQIEFSLQILVATMDPIFNKAVNTNIRHPLCISCPSRPRCRTQTSSIQGPELGWP